MYFAAHENAVNLHSKLYGILISMKNNKSATDSIKNESYLRNPNKSGIV